MGGYLGAEAGDGENGQAEMERSLKPNLGPTAAGVGIAWARLKSSAGVVPTISRTSGL